MSWQPPQNGTVGVDALCDKKSDAGSATGNGHDPASQLNGAESAVAGVLLSFTRFKSQDRLSKRYDLGPDGKVITTGGTEMYRGEYETITIDGRRSACDIGRHGATDRRLRSVRGNWPRRRYRRSACVGEIITKDKYERCHDNPRSTYATRSRAPSRISSILQSGLGLVFFDGDEKRRSVRDPDRAMARIRRGRRSGAAVGVGLGEGSGNRRSG